MKITSKLLPSLLTLLVACHVYAADSKPAPRFISIVEVETDDPTAYCKWIKQNNEIAKAKLNVENHVRVYQSLYDGRTTGLVRAVTSASSVAELMKTAQTLDDEPAIRENRDHMRAIRKTGSRVLYQALRHEGPNPIGAHNYNTLAVLSDEAAYLRAIDELRSIYDANGFQDSKIAVYRVLVGRTDHSHRIVISTPSRDRLAALLDFGALNPQLQTWFASTAKIRTVVANYASREITK